MLDFHNRYDVDEKFSIIEYFVSQTSLETESTAVPQDKV